MLIWHQKCLQSNFHSRMSGGRSNFCSQVFNLGMRIVEKIDKSIDESKFVHQTITKSWKDVQLFDQWPGFSAN